MSFNSADHDARHRSFNKENGGKLGGATPQAPRPTAFSLAVVTSIIISLIQLLIIDGKEAFVLAGARG